MDPVANNLSQFQNRVSENRYEVLLNRKTGEIRFAHSKGGVEEKAKDWRKVQVVVQKKGDRTSFGVKDLSSSDLAPLAWKVIKQTFGILNGSISNERLEDLPGWHGAISRIEAEQKLADQPIGTYLLRDGDEITLSMASNLAEENQLFIQPYLLTMVTEDGFSDILLLQTNRGWTFYNDNPNLNISDYVSTPKALLDKIDKGSSMS